MLTKVLLFMPICVYDATIIKYEYILKYLDIMTICVFDATMNNYEYIQGLTCRRVVGRLSIVPLLLLLAGWGWSHFKSGTYHSPPHRMVFSVYLILSQILICMSHKVLLCMTVCVNNATMNKYEYIPNKCLPFLYVCQTRWCHVWPFVCKIQP